VADFYTSISATASNLINKFGKEIAIHREIGGTFDGGTGEETGATTDTQTLNAVVLPLSARDERYKAASLTHERVSGCKLSGSALAWEPTLGDRVVFNSESWEILSKTPLNPNDGAVIIYDMVIGI